MVSQPCPGGLAGPRPVACSHPRLGCPGRVWMAPGWEALWVSPTPCVGTLRTACDGHVHWGRAGVCVTFCGHSTCFYFLSIMKMRMGLITYLVFRAKFASLHISPGIVVAFGCYYILRSLGVRDFSTCSFSEWWWMIGCLWQRALENVSSLEWLCFLWVAIIRVIKLNTLASCVIYIKILL